MAVVERYVLKVTEQAGAVFVYVVEAFKRNGQALISVLGRLIDTLVTFLVIIDVTDLQRAGVFIGQGIWCHQGGQQQEQYGS